SADDEQTNLAAKLGMAKEQQRKGSEQDVDPLDLLDASDEKDEALALIASEQLARVRLTDRMENIRIDAAGDHRDLCWIGAVEPAELAELDVARSHDRRRLADALALDLGPDVALAIDVLIHHLALHETQGVEHLDDRHLPPLLERARDLRREPVVGVDDVVGTLLLLYLGDQLLGEFVEMLEHGHFRPVAKG